MIDTGASLTSIQPADAFELGVSEKALRLDRVIHVAAFGARAAPFRLQRFRTISVGDQATGPIDIAIEKDRSARSGRIGFVSIATGLVSE